MTSREGEEAAAPATRSGFAGAVATIAEMYDGARRLIGERPGARVRRVRRMAAQPLANLWDVAPEARRASLREIGIQTVPVELIAGTAVEGPPQRGGDYLPLRDRRSDDWRGRWQRIRNAIETLQPLPPVELIKFGDQFWVSDGHNRVAAALYLGQIALDANVIEYLLPGMAATPPGEIGAVLEGSADLRAAGQGRLSRTVTRSAPLSARRPDSGSATE